jgi:hypothetical protein
LAFDLWIAAFAGMNGYLCINSILNQQPLRLLNPLQPADHR